MLLRLTLSDVSRLRRDRNIAVTDISYVDGVMRFLGVRVDEGGVTTSVLSSTQDSQPGRREREDRLIPSPGFPGLDPWPLTPGP